MKGDEEDGGRAEGGGGVGGGGGGGRHPFEDGPITRAGRCETPP